MAQLEDDAAGWDGVHAGGGFGGRFGWRNLGFDVCYIASWRKDTQNNGIPG